MKKVKIEFNLKSKYYIETTLTDVEYEIIKDLDFDDVSMYKKNGKGKTVENELYTILEKFIDPENIIESDDELTEVIVENIDE